MTSFTVKRARAVVWVFSFRVDLSAVPPGSSLALPKIYSLIHWCCCHMAPLWPLPPWAPASISPSIPLPESPSSQGPPVPVSPPPGLLSPPGLEQALCLLLPFISKVSADPMVLPSAIDASLSGPRGASVLQTLLTACVYHYSLQPKGQIPNS